jgi:hypothetical protein
MLGIAIDNIHRDKEETFEMGWRLTGMHSQHARALPSSSTVLEEERRSQLSTTGLSAICPRTQYREIQMSGVQAIKFRSATPSTEYSLVNLNITIASPSTRGARRVMHT